MTKANIRQQPVTHRDGYLMLRTLAYTIEAVALLPEERQEASNARDMEALLEHHAGAAVAAQLRMDSENST